MMNYFKPLRRKFGLIALVVDCAVCVLWVRSQSNKECTEIQVNRYATVIIGSTNHVLGLAWHLFDDPNEMAPFLDYWSWPEVAAIEELLSTEYLVLDPIAEAEMTSGAESDMKWLIRIAGFKMGQSKFLPSDKSRVSFAIVPYWSIVLPLTAISAWWLLSTPRTKINLPTSPATENA